MRKLFFTLVLSLMTLTSNAQVMKLGDLNYDNQVNITDVIMLVDIVLNGYSPFSVSPTEVTMQAGGTAKVNIEGGYYYYEVETANPDIVDASLNDMTVTLTAKAGGETTVTVKDVLTFRTIDIPVVVECNALQLSTAELSLIAGEQGTVDVLYGSGSYSVESSDTEVATVNVNNNTVSIIAVGVGFATITVNDVKNGQTATIDVEVTVANPTSYLTCPDGNHPHLIDLGLPSGTKWACCNVGATTPESYGGYYAWGETEEKNYYLWGTYQYSDENGNCQSLGGDIAGTDYDVAHVKWGGSWVMPSHEQQMEMLNNCTYTGGVKGGYFTGPNGGTIFLPAAGYRSDRDLKDAGSYGSYWSSQENPSSWRNSYSYYYRFSTKGTYWDSNSNSRNYGLSVRPVDGTYKPLFLSTNRVEVIVNDKITVEITSGNGSYTISCSAPNVATALLFGNSITIKGIATGSAVVTVTDMTTGNSQDISVGVHSYPCPDSNHPHLIDLGLPSGTKWACCNVGATIPEDHGGYYAWGETEEKDYYSTSTYTYYDSFEGQYNFDFGRDIAYTDLDVAHVKWGGPWVIPSGGQQQELLNNCTYIWISINGVEGGLFFGPSGGSIFLPAAGYRYNDKLSESNRGYYRTSTLDETDAGEGCLYFDSDDAYWSWYGSIASGFTVRPVAGLSLSTTTLGLLLNATGTVEVTTGSGSYTVESNNEAVAMAAVEGSQIIVTAIGVGTATITVRDATIDKTATIDVAVTAVEPLSYLTCPDSNHPHLIDLGLPSGTKWACCNVGANTPEDFGGYYAWGETEEKSVYNWSTYQYSDAKGNCLSLGSDIAGTFYDVAHVKWGASWMIMPSIDQIKELHNNCTYTWTTMNGVKGRKFMSKTNGGTLFLPLAGYRKDGDLCLAGSYGHYWSSTQYPSNSFSAYYLYFNSGSTYWNSSSSSRYFGQSVRPVSR